MAIKSFKQSNSLARTMPAQFHYRITVTLTKKEKKALRSVAPNCWQLKRGYKLVGVPLPSDILTK